MHRQSLYLGNAWRDLLRACYRGYLVIMTLYFRQLIPILRATLVVDRLDQRFVMVSKYALEAN